MRRDFNFLVTVLAIFGLLLLLDLPAFLTEWNTTLQGALQPAVAFIRDNNLYGHQKAEDHLWQRIKGTNTQEVSYGQIPTYKLLYANRLAALGLAVDEDGTVVPAGQVGKLRPPYKFLVIGGSSIADQLGIKLEEDLKKIPNMTVIRLGVYSTGLNRKDYYNWNKKLKELIREHNPDAIVGHYGGNDGQMIQDDSGVWVALGTPRWSEIYTQRVEEFMETASQAKRVFWIENPIAATDEFRWKFTLTNGIYKKVAAKYNNIIYIPTWDKTTVNGRYSNTLPDKNGKVAIWKLNDGVHVTAHGARILSDIILDAIKPQLSIGK